MAELPGTTIVAPEPESLGPARIDDTGEPSGPTLGPSPQAMADYLGAVQHAARIMKTEYAAPEKEFDPDTLSLIGAAFRRQNMVGSFMADQTRGVTGEGTPDLSAQEVYARLEKEGLQDYANLFEMADNEGKFDARLGQLKQELEDKRTLAAGGWTGFGLEMAAGVLDVPTFFPVVKGAQLARAARGASGTRSAAAFGGASAADALVAETALQGTQLTRDVSETAMNVGASAILGSALGIAAHRVVGWNQAKAIEQRMDNDLDDLQSVARMSNELKQERTNVLTDLYRRFRDGESTDAISTTTAGSYRGKYGEFAAGGSGVVSPREALMVGASETARIKTLGLDKVFKLLPTIARKMGGEGLAFNLSNIRIDAQDSISPAERRWIQQIDPHSPWIQGSDLTRKRVEGVTDYKSRFEGGKANAIHDTLEAWKKIKKMGGFENQDEFYKEVYKASINQDMAVGKGTRSPEVEAIVEQTAKSWRSNVYDPILAQLKENKTLPEDLDTQAALSYLPLLYDVEKVRGDRQGFTDYMTGAFRNEFKERVRELQVARQAGAFDREDRLFKNKQQLGERLEKSGQAFDKEWSGARADFEKAAQQAKVQRNDGIVKAKRNFDTVKALAEDSEGLRAADNKFNAHIEEAAISAGERVDAAEEQFKATAGSLRQLRDTEYEALSKKKSERIAQSRVDEKEALAQYEKGSSDYEKTVREYERKRATIEADHKLARAKTRKTFESSYEKALDVLSREESEAEKAFNKLEREASKVYDAEIKGAKGSKQAKQAYTDYLKERRRLAREYEGQLRALRKSRNDRVSEARATRDETRKQAQGDRKKKDQAARLDVRDSIDPDVLAAARFVNPEKLEEAAVKAAKEWWTTITNEKNTNMLMEFELARKRGHFAKFRKNPGWQLTMMERGWLRNNIQEIGEQYANRAGMDAAFGAVFKRLQKTRSADGEVLDEWVGDPSLENLKSEIVDDFQRLLDESDGAEHRKILEQRNRSLQRVDTLRDMMMGHNTWDRNGSNWQRTAELAGQFNYLRLMGGMVASSLGDPINLAVANGWGRAWSYGWKPMATNLYDAYKNADGPLRKASRTAGAVMEIETNARVVQMADVANPLSATNDPWLNAARKTSQVFTKYSGIQFWNSWMKQIAYNTNQARIIEHASDGWGKLSKAEQVWLRSLGLDGNDLSKIKEAWDAQDTKQAAGIPFADWENWADRATANRLRAALASEVDNIVVTPSAADKLAFVNTPHGRLILQFRQHMMANQARLIGRNVALAQLDDTLEKPLALGSGLFALGMAGVLIAGTKEVLGNMTATGGSSDTSGRSGLDKYLERWTEAPERAAYDALDRSGIFGPYTEINNISEKLGLPSLVTSAQWALGRDQDQRTGARRFANRRWYDAVFGPTAGALVDVATAGSIGYDMAWNNSLGLLDEDAETKFTRGQFRSARRALIFQNVPFVQQALNLYEGHLGNVYDWPESR